MEGELVSLGDSKRADSEMVYASPAVNDMLNQKGTEFEGKDFFDLVFGQSILLWLSTILTISTRPTSITKSLDITSPSNTSTTTSTKFQLSQHRFKFPDTTDSRQQSHV